MRSHIRDSLVLLALSLTLCAVLFGPGALTGSRILAPVDIPPALFRQYAYVDPGHASVPENHYIIDGVFQDLPSQFYLYTSLRQGEIPWWTPFDWAGRPFLADSHANGSNPLRLLCFAVLPFELAYNWTLLFQILVSGLGAFWLLRTLVPRSGFAWYGAVLWEFAGPFAFYFCHPFVAGTFAWYPWIWLAWQAAMGSPLARYRIAATVFSAMALYGANLQTAAYLPLFLLALVIGYRTVSGLAAALRLAATIGVLAVLLAAPILLQSVEAYAWSARADRGSWQPSLLLMPFASLSGIFPWALGTFKTLDLGRFLGTTGIGVVLFAGSLTPLLALFGVLGGRPPKATSDAGLRTAWLLPSGYLLMVASPLFPFLYTRAAPLGLLGILVLATRGWEALSTSWKPRKTAALALGALTISLILALNVFAYAIYPRIKDRLMDRVMRAEAAGGGPIGNAPALRQAQVENLPREIGLQNPETACSALLLLLSSALLARPTTPPRWAWLALLGLNLFPVLSYYHRFTPSHPVALWQSLQEGGPLQQSAVATLSPGALRFLETAPTRTDMLIPQNFTLLYRIHAVHGYCSLQPASLFLWPKDEPYPEASIVSDATATPDGQLVLDHAEIWSRLQWIDGAAEKRSIRFLAETSGTLTAEIGPGAAGTLRRTDTLYPGWSATYGGAKIPIVHAEPCFSTITLPASDEPRQLVYSYRPTYLTVSFVLAGLGALGLAGLRFCGHAKPIV